MARTWPFNASNALTFAKGTHNTTLDNWGLSSCTISFWLWINGHITTQQTILSRFNGSQGPLVRLSDSSPGHISFFGINSSLAGVDAIGATLLVVNRWYHVACTIDLAAVNKPARVYLNGVQDGTANYGATGISGVASNTLNFGRREVPNLPLDGRLADVSYFAGALDVARIAALARGASPIRMATALIAYWPLLNSGDNGVYYWGNNHDQDITRLTLVGSLASADGPPVGYRVPFPG